MSANRLPTTSSRVFHHYLVPLLILACLFCALRWIPVQIALAWVLPLAAAALPAHIAPLHIVLAVGLAIGGVFAVLVLRLTRWLHRRVLHRQRLRRLDEQRRRGHDDIAACVFDPNTVALDEEEVGTEHAPDSALCALEKEPRLALLITLLWGKSEFHNFVQRLLRADAGSGRALNPQMRHELMFLRNLLLDQSGTVTRGLTLSMPAMPLQPRRHRAAGAVLMCSLLLLPVV